MVKLNRIYTRTGDDGLTGLGNGERRRKDDARVAAYGEVDETNAAIGTARAALRDAPPELDAILGRIQNDLFDLGADLCVPPRPGEHETAALRIQPSQVDRLEREIDAMNADLTALTSFVLPAGSAGSSALHLARTICRRAERSVVTLAATPGEAVGEPALRYLNRLSDLLFVAARWANDRGGADVLWVPGSTR
jgi:cob(I)alamin adenosyltransferase